MTAFERPQFHEIDAWGLTHEGHVREENQDHFFVGSLARGITVNATSVTARDREVLLPERLASLGMVADGVGSTAGGGEAARLAVRELLSAVSERYWDADVAEDDDPEVFERLLNDAALSCHETLLQKAEEDGTRKFATTLTLFLGLWPHAYLLQVGDSRCYIYQDGALTQISQDQTLAEELVANGTLSRAEAEQTRWVNVLSSAIGGREAAPVVTRVVRDWGSVVLLCSDGLTKHVSDVQIEARLADYTTARETAERLLQDALDDGGTDTITIVIGKSVKRADESRTEGR